MPVLDDTVTIGWCWGRLRLVKVLDFLSNILNAGGQKCRMVNAFQCVWLVCVKTGVNQSAGHKLSLVWTTWSTMAGGDGGLPALDFANLRIILTLKKVSCLVDTLRAGKRASCFTLFDLFLNNCRQSHLSSLQIRNIRFNLNQIKTEKSDILINLWWLNPPLNHCL